MPEPETRAGPAGPGTVVDAGGTVAGPGVAADTVVLVGGAVVVEVLFSLPGMGTLLYEAISARQYIALQSLVAIIAVGYVLINFLVDVLYAVLDPRIRY